jgi:hypothetical protein
VRARGAAGACVPARVCAALRACARGDRSLQPGLGGGQVVVTARRGTYPSPRALAAGLPWVGWGWKP